jgi:ribosomal protein S1
LRPVQVGDIVSGTVVEVGRPYGVAVRLDGGLGSANIGDLDLSWRDSRATQVQIGQRVTAEVIAVEGARISLSTAATEHPQLWAFLTDLRCGDVLSGVVADIQNYGVFVALDEGPPHPVFVRMSRTSATAASRPRRQRSP